MKKELIKSPIYNMSMDSLENFHTSFLCWLLNTYKEFIKLFTNNTNFLSCKKQQSHGNNIRTDLEIELNNKEIIIIENKLKSFPNNEQLEKYSEFFNDNQKKVSFVLLSLAKQKQEDLPNGWQPKSYSELARKMDKIFNENFENIEDYHKYLIKDYISVIKEISSIFSKADSIEKEKYNFYKYDDKEYKAHPINKYDLRNIFIKYRTSELANYINENINKKHNWGIEEGFSTKRKEGFVDIIKKLDENNRFHIQIQGKQYRYGFVHSEKISKAGIEIAEKLLNKYWFVDTTGPKRKTNYGEFYGNKPNFLYRCSNTELNENTTYKEIITKINNDIESFENNLGKIKECINTFVSEKISHI